jgi:uncharacterized protein DUF2357/PD-(D/E)XK nuclease superfamily protein
VLLSTSTGEALQPIPASNGGFRELMEVAIVPPPGGPWELRIDDEPVALQGGAWRWRPGFYAGEVTAQLLGAGGQVAAEYLLDVSPDDRKLGRDRFREVLEEVLDEDPLLVVGDEPATILHGNQPVADNPLSALLGFARMRAYGPRFIRALQEAARQPRMVVRRRRAEEPPQRVRRVDAGSLRSLARSGIAGVPAFGSEPAPAIPARPVRVDVPFAEPHVDGAANRAVVALIQFVARRIRVLQERLPRLGERERSETRTSLSSRLPGRLAFLERVGLDLLRALRSEPWKQITRPELSAAGLNALAAEPLYARAYQMAWRALRMGAGMEHPEDRLWLSPTWELFERWCFVQVGKLLKTRFPTLSWTRLGPGAHPSGAAATWEGAGPSRVVSLLLQPEFPSGDQKPRWGFRSISRQRFPDLVVTWERGEQRGFFALDAKYRVSRQGVLESMESAHLYRDSLRWHGARPDLALLLLPAPGEAVWLSVHDFHRSERVGAVELRDDLPQVVWEALG